MRLVSILKLFCFLAITAPVSMIGLAVAQNIFITPSPTASPSPTPFVINIKEPPRYQMISAFGTPNGKEVETEKLMDQQDKMIQNGGSASVLVQGGVFTGQARAAQMIEILKTQEMDAALKKATVRGKEILANDPSLQGPLGVIAGASTLWIGSTIRLFDKNDYKFTTRVEGRSQTSEFNMESPILSGKLVFTPANGIDIKMNRKISSIRTEAEFNFNANSQATTATLRHKIAPNLDLTFGTSNNPTAQTNEQTSKIEYHFNF